MQTSTWEWIISLVAALLVIGATGYVAYRALTEQTTAPEIVFEVERVHSGSSGYLVEFWAYNRGGRTAKGLTVEATLRSDTGVVATRSATFTFVPGESRRKGGLFFPVDPRLFDLEMYPVGYDAP